ncbi:protein of unknown function [Cyanobium sp. NIES-981]|nr:protein of unknown function [Cyanobium sp. NIES-981]
MGQLADQALDRLSPTFSGVDLQGLRRRNPTARTAVPLEQLLLASLMQTWASRISLERIDGPDDPPPPPSGPGEGVGCQTRARSQPTWMAAASCPATRPIVPASIPIRCSTGNPRPTLDDPVPGERADGQPLCPERGLPRHPSRGHPGVGCANAMATAIPRAYQQIINGDKNNATKRMVTG